MADEREALAAPSDGGYGAGGGGASGSGAWAASLERAALRPGVIGDADPSEPLAVAFGASDDVHGQLVKCSAAMSTPVVTLGPQAAAAAEGDGLMVLMFDPDVPGFLQPGICHWMVLNYGSPDAVTVQEYMGPGPPANTGPHRYVFVALKQARRLAAADVKLPSRFALDAFRKTHAAVLKEAEGGPLAVAYYVARYDCTAKPCCTTLLLCSYCCPCCAPPEDFRAKQASGPPMCTIQ